MNQKKLLLILACTALAILAAAGIGVGGASFGWFEGDDAQSARHAPGAAGTDAAEDAEAADFEANIAGRDEHGEYRIGESGGRVYRDGEGGYFIVDANGNRIATDAKGRGKFGRLLDHNGGMRGRSINTSPSKDPVTGDGGAEAAKDDEGKDTAAISGVIVDEEGKPFGGAKVHAVAPGGATLIVVAAEDGAFTIAKAPTAKLLRVYARSPFSDAVSNEVQVTLKGPWRIESPLVLVREFGIRGVVRSAEGGALGDAEVVLFEPTGQGVAGRVKSTTKTAADGAFAFPTLSKDSYRLQVSRDGFAPTMLANISPPRTLEVWLSPGASVTGRVTNEAGEPIKGALISCDFVSEPVQKFHTEAMTDADGNYAVSCQPESQQNLVKVIAPGYHSRSRNYVRSGATGVDFKLQPTGNVILRGRLVRKNGEAIATATLAALDAEGKNARIAQRVGPAADGVFWAEVVPAGVKLRVRSSGLAELNVDYAPVEGGEVQLGDLTMDAGVVVFGVIRTAEDDMPVEMAFVRVGPLYSASDEQGRYRIEGLTYAAFTLVVQSDLYAPFSVRLTPSGATAEIEHNIKLTNGRFEARVIVKDAQTQTVLPGAHVNLDPSGQGFVAGTDGIAHLKELTQVIVKAKASAEGYAAKDITITAASASTVATKPPQEVLLSPGGMIEGVVNSAGTPLAGMTVEIWDGQKKLGESKTDGEGRYKTQSLEPGEYFVSAPAQGLAPRRVTLPAEGATLDLEVGHVCHLRGRILRHGSQPHGSAGVYVYRRDNIYLSQTLLTDTDGRYEVMNLFPGQWVFCILKSQGDQAAQYSIPVNVTTAGWANADIQLPQATGVLTGRVTYPGGGPARNARVCVTNLSANFTRACLSAYVLTDNQGYYRAERLENGAQMIARVGGYADGASTGTAFGAAVLIPANETPAEADIVVPNTGLGFSVGFARADGGPLLETSVIAYLVDGQGRASGLYFGGGRYKGNIALRDVVPGTYTLIVTSRGMKASQTQLVVGTEAPQLEVLLEPETRNP